MVAYRTRALLTETWKIQSALNIWLGSVGSHGFVKHMVLEAGYGVTGPFRVFLSFSNL